MKKGGGYVPGVRPGQATSDFLHKTMSRITLAGAIFLTIIAVVPIIMSSLDEHPAAGLPVLWRHQPAHHGRRHARHHAADGGAIVDAAISGVLEERPSQGPVLTDGVVPGSRNSRASDDHFKKRTGFGSDAAGRSGGGDGAGGSGLVHPAGGDARGKWTISRRRASSFTRPRAPFWGIGSFRAIFAFRSMNRWCMGWPGRAAWSSGTLSAWTSACFIAGLSGTRRGRWRWAGATCRRNG